MTVHAEVELRRGGFHLNVELSVADGQALAVLGPNGAGKSTLLDALSGLSTPQRGRISLGDTTVLDTAARINVPAHRRRISLLAQQPLLFPHLSVHANVEFGPRATGTARAEAARIAEHWLAEVDAADLAQRKPRQLSGGQAQRVALARALAAQPKLLLLDEPFAALDVDAAPAARGLTRRVLRASGLTTLLVTHDPLDALTLADQVIVLDRGRIVEQGPATQVLSRPRTPFAARIGGLNLISGVACDNGLRTDDGTVISGHVSEPLTSGESAVAVFRPATVAVHCAQTSGSPRNVFPAVVSGMEPRGDVIRVRAASMAGGPRWADGLAADLTPAAVADLHLEPGAQVYFAVKAAEVAVYGS